jgi:small subunit ribosomal protein S2
MKDMLEAGVHFGHQVARWNPKMKPYVFGARGGIYIIDLQKTVTLAQDAAKFVKQLASDGGRMIFVGTKKQARETIQEAAKSCGQFYMTERWLGGTLTNFETIKQNIDRLRKLDQMKEKGEMELYSKKEASGLEKERIKLTQSFEGIRIKKARWRMGKVKRTLG